MNKKKGETYKKRPGTSGIRGQLFETKLIALINFRAKFDENIQQFHLATNMDEIGEFDDICFKAKVKGCESPVAFFIQAKHREGSDKVLTLNSKNELVKYFSSYQNIRRAFSPTNKNVFFKGDFDKTVCLFVMYTTAGHEPNVQEYKGNFADHLHNLIGTGKSELPTALTTGIQPAFKDDDVEVLCDVIVKEQFVTVASQLAKFLCDESDPVMPLMTDELLLRFHVLLSQKVFELFEIQLRHEEDEHRIANFRQDFFKCDDEPLTSFKNTLCKHIHSVIKKRKLNEPEIIDLLIAFFDDPSDITTLSKLVENVVTYNNGKLAFVNEMPEDTKTQLSEVNVSRDEVDQAVQLAAEEILRARRFKVPAAFGNKDLTVRGKVDVNIESILNEIKTKIVDLLNDSKHEHIIGIDQSLEDKFLQHNCGLASAIGNILVFDEDTKLIKFTESFESLEDLAKRLFVKIKREIHNMHQYRFVVKVGHFPKLSLDSEGEENVAEIIAVAEEMANFLCKEEIEDVVDIMPMNELLFRYHVILAQKAVDVSAIQRRNEENEHRVARFQRNFFDSQEKLIAIFRRTLYIEILKKQKLSECEINNFLTLLFKDPLNISILSRLVEHVVTLENGKLKFVIAISEDSRRQLDQLDVPKSTVDEAIEKAAKEMLTERQFKVPAAFGNKDLTITGNKKLKIESRLNHLKKEIGELLKSADDNGIVTLKESLKEGLLGLNGGLSGIVGNILVPDENTKYLKFTNNFECLEELAKRLFTKVQSVQRELKLQPLQHYKIDVKVKKFPKHVLKGSDHDESQAKDFFRKLIFYTNQADETNVGETLKSEIEERRSNEANSFRITSDAIYLEYHDKIQTWWMAPKEATFLTKKSTLYEDAVENIMNKPLTAMVSLMYKIKTSYSLDYKYNEVTINSLKLLEPPPGTFFVTKSSMLTVAKLTQYLEKQVLGVFDLGYILKLPPVDYNSLCKELIKINEEKTLIIICNNIQTDRIWCQRLENIAKVLNVKPSIIVTNKASLDTLKKHFVRTHNVEDDEKISLADMTEDTQKNILQEAKVIFQGEELSLNMIVDDIAMSLIEGEVLNKVILKETLSISKSIGNKTYDEIKHLYIDRRVARHEESKPGGVINATNNNDTVVTTLNCLEDVALVTAIPGMGKSTLLTHLSLKTKEIDSSIWIVRMNLQDWSHEFKKWQTDKVNVDVLESLVFMCKVIVSEKQDEENNLNITLQASDGVVELKDCSGDEWTALEVKMFLHFYNKRRLIFLFDAFDEICPHYAHEVISLMKIVKDYPQSHKMWITSRSYDNAISSLEQVFGKSYEILTFSKNEQDEYLSKLWESEINLKELNKDQMNNVCTFLEFISPYFSTKTPRLAQKEQHQMLFLKVCLNFLAFIKRNIDADEIRCSQDVIHVFNTLIAERYHIISFYENFDTPLHMYLVAEYFVNQIKDVNKVTYKWNLDINVFTVYEQFIETKLKKIRFQQKNKIDLNISDNIIIYEDVREDFYNKHRKLGAYTVFHPDREKLFTEIELNEIKQIIRKIKHAKEKTGLIYSVANNIPKFIHMTFAEYFAVEYICVILQTVRAKDISLWDLILNVILLKSSTNFRNILGYKIKINEKLQDIVQENVEIIFNLLLEQGKGVYAYNPDDFSKELYLKIHQTLSQAIENFDDFVSIIYKLKAKLSQEDYLYDESYDRSTKTQIIFVIHKVRTKLLKMGMLNMQEIIRNAKRPSTGAVRRKRRYALPSQDSARPHQLVSDGPDLDLVVTSSSDITPVINGAPSDVQTVTR